MQPYQHIYCQIVGFTDDYLKISQKNSKGLAGRYKLIGQLIATGAALFILIGPLSEVLTGADGKQLKQPKMRELWAFFEEVVIANMPVVLCFLFFL